MKQLNKAAIIISKICEVGFWAATAISLVLTVISAIGKFEWFKYLTDITSGETELSVSGFSFELGIAQEFDKRAFIMFFITAVLVFSLMAMIFRNVYLIMKTTQGKTSFAKGETPFQPDNIRMVREIGIFFILISAAGYIMSIAARIVFGTEIEVQCDFTYILVGIVVICLSQYFDYGMKLQKEVDGLL